MAYLDELLAEGENVVFTTRQHKFILIASVLTEFVLVVLLAATAYITPQAFPDDQFGTIIRWGAVALGVVVVLSGIRDYLRWSSEEYIVTDRRVIQLRGIVNKSVLDSALEKINDVEMHQGVGGRMFDYGDIEILTASESGINKMPSIAHPLQFKKAMLDARARYDHYLDRSPIQAYANDSNHVQDTLSQLASLHARGILNDAEFEAKKREILSRI